jgi:hypothetical protein
MSAVPRKRTKQQAYDTTMSAYQREIESARRDFHDDVEHANRDVQIYTKVAPLLTTTQVARELRVSRALANRLIETDEFIESLQRELETDNGAFAVWFRANFREMAFVNDGRDPLWFEQLWSLFLLVCENMTLVPLVSEAIGELVRASRSSVDSSNDCDAMDTAVLQLLAALNKDRFIVGREPPVFR